MVQRRLSLIAVFGLQIVLATAGDAQGSPPDQSASDAASVRPTFTKPFQIGVQEQSSPIHVIQRSRNGFPTDADFNPSPSVVPPLDSKQFILQAQRASPLSASLNTRGWLPPQYDPSVAHRLRASINRQDVNPLSPLNFLQPMWAPYVPPAPPPPPQPVRGVRMPALPLPLATEVSREIGRQLSRENGVDDGSFSELHGHLRPPAFDASAEIEGQLRQARKPAPVADVDGELRAQQASAKPLADREAARASSEITAVFRRLPRPIVDLETQAHLLANNSESGINWDAWYARVAKLSEPRLVKCTESTGGPSGSNTVSIIVHADRHIEVTVVHSSNKAFDAAVLRAYRGLDGNPGLAFPAGSQRQEVTFLADNNHLAAGDVSGITTRTCVGDIERGRGRR